MTESQMTPLISQNGFCRPTLDESNDVILDRPNLTPHEAREIHANVLNYMSNRIATLTRPAWPWDTNGNPVDRRLIEE